jgi:rubrerythrin
MNLKNIIDLLDLNKIDQAEITSVAARRGFFKKAGDISIKAALASVPLALTFLPRIAKAQSSSIADTLNFALTLEYLEDEFYKMALNASGLIPESDRKVFMQISKHETAHVNFLKAALGGASISKPSFDFTAGGLFPNAFSDYGTFLTLSQAFEDTGVRAYKGQAGNLMSDHNTLTAALQIHSVEARHASEVRRLRGKTISQPIKGWITGNTGNGAPAAVYAGEDNTIHADANLNSISALNDVSATAKTESFDEPLTKEQVVAIVTPFISA